MHRGEGQVCCATTEMLGCRDELEVSGFDFLGCDFLREEGFQIEVRYIELLSVAKHMLVEFLVKLEPA